MATTGTAPTTTVTLPAVPSLNLTPPSTAAGMRQMIAFLQYLVATANAELTGLQAQLATNPAIRQQVAAGRMVASLATALIADYQALILPAVAPTAYIVQPGDTIYLLAEQKLGSALLYPSIKNLNGLRGSAIYPGQVLQLPMPATGVVS